MASSTTQSPSTRDLEAQVSAIKTDIAQLTEMMREMGKAQAASVKSAASEKIASAKDKSEAQLRDLREQAELRIMEAEDTIKANPTASVGIAAGIGFVIGLLTARR